MDLPRKGPLECREIADYAMCSAGLGFNGASPRTACPLVCEVALAPLRRASAAS